MQIKNRFLALLTYSEKYTKTDMKYFAHGNFWLFIGRIVATLTGIGLTITFANLLTKEAFGTYRYVLSAAGFLMSFTLSGMGTAITRAVAQGNDGVIYSSFKTSIIWSLGATFLAFIAVGYYLIHDNLILAISFLIIGLVLPLSSATGLSKSFLHGKKDFKLLTTSSIPRNIITIGIMIVTVFLTKNILIIIAVYFSSSLLASWLVYLYVLNKHKPIQSDDEKNNTFNYSKHLSLSGFFTQMASQLDQLLLWHFAGPIQVAMYTFATAPVKEIGNLTSNIYPLALPKFANKKIEDVKKMIPLRMMQISIILALVVISYILAAPYIFKILFPQYIDAVRYSQFFSLFLLFQSKEFISTTIIAHAKIKKNYIITITQSVAKILLLLILLPLYGIMGAIIAILLSEIISTIILFILLRKM